MRLLLRENGDEINWLAIARRANFHHTAALLRFNLIEAGLSDAAPPQFRSDFVARTEVEKNVHARKQEGWGLRSRLIVSFGEAGLAILRSLPSLVFSEQFGAVANRHAEIGC